jgi:hypothetical protein
VPDLVMHVGMQHSGARMLQRSLWRLRPQLRAHGVAFIGHRQISGMDHLAGWRAHPDAAPERAGDFARELTDIVMHERKRIVDLGGPPSGVVLLASDHLLGAPNLSATDEERFRPLAVDALSQVIDALGADDVRVLLHTHRQDRLMEFCYQRAIRGGAFHRFREQFPDCRRPRLDYNDLIARLQAVPRVSDVLVRPFELAAAGAQAFADDFLAAVDLRGILDLDPVGDDLTPHHAYSPRGVKIALAMNPHLDTDRDRRLVREFLLEHFAAEDDRQERFLSKRLRREILAAYTDVNRELFRVYMPQLPHDSYDGDLTTARLGSLLPDIQARRDRVDSASDGGRGRAARLPVLFGGRRGVRDASLAGRRVPRPVAEAVARVADRVPLLYRAKVRVLARRCDVFIVSFPKCGRTWLRMQVGMALREHFRLRVRNLLRLTNAQVAHPGLPRILATHDDSPQGKQAHQVMRDKRVYAGTRVILLVRDPRDVIVSLYFHVTRRRGVEYQGDLMEFARERRGGLASLLAFYDAWAPRIDDGVLLLRYEDLHADPIRELRRVLAFLGMADVAPDVVQRAVAQASFDQLQQLERTGTAGTRALRTATPDDRDSYKVRRGKVGGYVDYLEPTDIATLDVVIARSAGAQAFGYAAHAGAGQGGLDRGRPRRDPTTPA